MKRATAGAVLLLALMVLLPGGSATGKASRTVEVDDNFFAPDTLKVKKGTTVKFNWVGEELHNVAKKKGPGGEFDSGYSSQQGVNFKKRFTKPGKYVLLCYTHEGMEMDLTVKRPRRN